MKITPHEQRVLVPRKRNTPKEGSLSARAALSKVPVGTLKTRLKKLVESGLDRDRAIEVALGRPIGPQGRPRKF
ncbi:hypothetical protein [Salinicola acroporae]|uniref:HTH luxR-type domain-containing protein n=1 Tax=Salinicola acroporae TaxID=1541440 RepID=A0ABT6HZQ8_9GAMM|nr:hypothetical protein [Salinicola acroporae]MDH4571007.1 hypothetical protein [Salinicola acroporae]MDH4574547.1 hypothetical protein [Salinicola acroporae]